MSLQTNFSSPCLSAGHLIKLKGVKNFTTGRLFNQEFEYHAFNMQILFYLALLAVALVCCTALFFHSIFCVHFFQFWIFLLLLLVVRRGSTPRRNWWTGLVYRVPPHLGGFNTSFYLMLLGTRHRTTPSCGLQLLNIFVEENKSNESGLIFRCLLVGGAHNLTAGSYVVGIDRACFFKMAGYWPRSLYCVFMD